jgi:hypothetical protein
MGTQKTKFFIAEHSILINNLNKISDDLLKSKWHFLASIATLGLSYSFIFNTDYNFPIMTQQLVFIMCIIGDIIFWLISEYVISHAFLFRYIQAKAAQKEYYFYYSVFNNKFIRDPSSIKQFVIFDYNNNPIYLNIDYIIPDQFLPIYWASIWLILINTAFACLAIGQYNYHFNFILIIISLILILKLFCYVIYKINKFIDSFCDFKVKINICYKNEYSFFYSIPKFNEYLITGLWLSLSVIFILSCFYELELHNILYIIFIITFFWMPILGLISHFWRYLFQISWWGSKGPPVFMRSREVFVCLNPLIYKIFGPINWIWRLLYAVI